MKQVIKKIHVLILTVLLFSCAVYKTPEETKMIKVQYTYVKNMRRLLDLKEDVGKILVIDYVTENGILVALTEKQYTATKKIWFVEVSVLNKKEREYLSNTY